MAGKLQTIRHEPFTDGNSYDTDGKTVRPEKVCDVLRGFRFQNRMETVGAVKKKGTAVLVLNGFSSLEKQKVRLLWTAFPMGSNSVYCNSTKSVLQ